MTELERTCYLAGLHADALEDHAWVIILLSPRMSFSLQEWPTMKRVAESMGFTVVSWKDPRVPPDEWRKAMAVALPPGKGDAMASDLRDMPVRCRSLWAGVNHSPFSLVAARTHLHPWPIWGVMPEQPWREALRFRLDAIRQAPPIAAPSSP